MTANILILGKGFIGKSLYKVLSQKHNAVQIISKNDYDYEGGIESYLDDLRFKHHIYIDVIINASGYTGVPNIDACENDKENCWKYNVVVPCRIYNNALSSDIDYIHISTGCIYNGYERQYRESDTPNFGLFNPESSFYSKTKHAAETMMEDWNCHILRIRMPFCGKFHSRNLFNKIKNYKDLSMQDNSMTCLEDFCDLVAKTIEDPLVLPKGTYNVVNKGSASLGFISSEMCVRGFAKWWERYVDHLDTKAPRSNCILSTDSLDYHGMGLPDVKDSILKCLDEWTGHAKSKGYL